LLVYNTNFYYRLTLGDRVVDHRTYARQQYSTSSSSSSRSCQSRDDQIDEMLRCHEEWMQYIISMMQINIFEYAIFLILYKYCLTMYLVTPWSKGTLCTVHHRRRHFLIPPHQAIHQPHTSTSRLSIKLLFCIQAGISIIKHA
jgi:hypothetical protein